MNNDKILILARKHLGAGSMESSARACLADAIAAVERDDYDAARMWALRSIAYSVGIGHRDYAAAAA